MRGMLLTPPPPRLPRRFYPNAPWWCRGATAMLCILQVPALVSPPVSTRQLAAELSQYGLTVLKEPQLDQAQLEQVRQRCSARLSALLDELQVQGGDPIEQHYTFAEIAHRQRLRWDLRLPEEDPLWQRVCDAALAAAMPVVEQLHPPCTAAPPRTLMSGVLISRSVMRTERMAPCARAWPGPNPNPNPNPYPSLTLASNLTTILTLNTDPNRNQAGSHSAALARRL